MIVVVAHPSPAERQALRDPLERAGYEVIEVADATALLDVCLAAQPDAALVDGSLVAEDGVSIVDQLKSDPATFTTAIVILLPREGLTSERAEDALRRGAHDVLLEPVSKIELLARMHAAARMKVLQEELVGQGSRLETLLHEDPLTGLFNRRYVLTRLSGLISGARRHGRPLSVAMADIDFFKPLNDEYGHEAGDAALVALALALRERLRAEDEVGRLGGEEFLILLPDADERAAAAVAESVRASVEALRIGLDGLDLSVTISVGWATWDREEDVDELLRRADIALYEAKRAGRNTVRGGQTLSATLRRRT